MESVILVIFGGLAFAGLTTDATPVWLDLAGLGLVLCTAFAHLELERPDRHRAVIAEFRGDAAPYRRRLGRQLVALRRWLKPPLASEHKDRSDPAAQSEAAARRTARHPFGWTLLDFALRLAVAYPVLSLLVQWIADGEGRLGTTVLLPAWQSWTEPVAAICVLAAFIVQATLYIWLTKRRQDFFRRFAGVLSLVPLAVAFAFAVAVIGAVAGAVAVAVAFAFAVAGAFAVAVAGAFAGAFAVAGAVAGAFAFAVAFAGAVAGAFAVAVAGAFAVAFFVRRGRPVVGYLLLTIFSLGIVATTLVALGAERLTEETATLLLFIGLLPILNGLFDFLSYGVTRALLEAGYRLRGAWPVVLGVLDLCFALIVFTLLGATLVCAVAVVNALAGGPVFDLGPVFADLRAPVPEGVPWWSTVRGDYGWLYFMLFSTLIPTVLHAAFAAFSLYRWVPGVLRRPLVGAIERMDESPYIEFGAKVGLGLARGAALALPLAALWGLSQAILHVAPLAGATYLQLFESLALWLGQVEEIGPGYISEGWVTGVDV